MPDLIGPKTLYLGFCGAIDDTNVGKMASALNQALNEQFDAVQMTFTSQGGFVGAGIFLYNHIRSLPIPVTICNTGMVASIAVPIYAAAEIRIASPNSMFMIHPVLVPANGHFMHGTLTSSLECAVADELRIDAILKERCAIPEDILAQRRSGDIFFSAQKALEFGLVHHVADVVMPPGNKVFHL